MSGIECPNCEEWIEVETVLEFNHLADFDEVSVECGGHCEGCGAFVQWSKVYVFSHDHDVVVMEYRTEN